MSKHGPVVEDGSLEQWMHSTRLFREWEKVKQDIQLHKWYRSEQAGHDIGWERAAVDWMIHHGKPPAGKKPL